MKKADFLVFGGSGMAGHTVCLYLTAQGHNVTSFDIRPSNICKSITGDVRDTASVENLISSNNYDAVINCVGILNQFAEENKELAVFLNSYFPHFLASLLKDSQTQLIHMSTDCVFSGKKGGYTEMDFPDGQTFYDRTKALGEITNTKDITLRDSIIGPDINQKGIGLFNWFMKQEGSIKGYTKAMWTGLTTICLAKAMECAALSRVGGLVNLVPNTAISKYDLLCLFNKYFKNNSLIIEPYDDFVSDKSLIRTNFNLEYKVPDYETMVEEMARWVEKYSSYYNF